MNYFLSLKILDSGKPVADNFYWLSTKKDRLDYKVNQWFYTPSSEYADFTMLDKMEKGKAGFNSTISQDGDYQLFNVELKNQTDKIAFFIEAKVVDKANGQSILPVLWSDNDVSLLREEVEKNKCKNQENLP